MSECSCLKDSFSSQRDAAKAVKAHAKRIGKRKSRDAGGRNVSTLHPYRCPDGNGWHIGNSLRRRP